MRTVGYAIIGLGLTSLFFAGGDACGAPQKRKRSVQSPVKEITLVEDNGDLLSMFKSLPDYRRLAHAIDVSERRTDQYVKAVYYILSAGLTKKEIHARIHSLLHTAMLTDGELYAAYDAFHLVTKLRAEEIEHLVQRNANLSVVYNQIGEIYADLNLTLKQECQKIDLALNKARKDGLIPYVECAFLSCDKYVDELYKVYLNQKEVPKAIPQKV